MLTPIYIDNDAIIQVSVTDADGIAVTVATVNATILRSDGTQVGDLVPMPHTTGGAYEGEIPDTLDVVEGEILDIKISATAGETVMTLWIAARAQKRRVIVNST